MLKGGSGDYAQNCSLDLEEKGDFFEIGGKERESGYRFI